MDKQRVILGIAIFPWNQFARKYPSSSLTCFDEFFSQIKVNQRQIMICIWECFFSYVDILSIDFTEMLNWNQWINETYVAKEYAL